MYNQELKLFVKATNGQVPDIAELRGIGDDKYSVAELVIGRKGNVVARLDAYRKGYQELTVLDANAGTYTRSNVFCGKVLGGTEKEQAVLDLFLAECKRFRTGAVALVRHAQTIHRAKNGGKSQLVDPTVQVPVGYYYVYPNPVGHHGQYNWNDRIWTGASRSSNPLMKRLEQTNARVFPRYCRKPSRLGMPGAFIGLGGPDAHIYRNDPECVEFIRRKTGICTV